MKEKIKSQDFRFFDSRQKYLLFVNTTNEKNKISQEITPHIKNIIPKKPAIKIFDAGLGDGTLLMSVLRTLHKEFPVIPFVVMGKEISMEDVRISTEKLADRFIEHPNMVFIVTNLHYSEASSLQSKNLIKNKNLNRKIVKLKGNSSFQFNLQLSQLEGLLEDNWQVERNKKSGNPTYKDPSLLIIYREDQEFILENIIPQKNSEKIFFDLIIASQPYRSRISIEKKVEYVIKPMINSLAKDGKLIIVHASGNDPGSQIINKVYPDETPFPSLGKDMIIYLKENLDKDLLKKIKFNEPTILKYHLRTLPNEIENGISTSAIFSAWNACTYVGQINDEKIVKAEDSGNHIQAIQSIIKENDGLWFNDEIILIEKYK